ncbi:MAG: hypothetical protein J0I08_20285 [Rhizobiales bacterium]|nr:hypothetical protein [Hyphomicrobiales bacterium]
MGDAMSGQHTPGPWAWFGNATCNSLYLATVHSGRRYVMDFTRWGMRGAQPRFQPGKGIMVDAKDLLQFEVGNQSVVGVDAAKKDPSVYRLDVRGIQCADARLIAAAPDLLEALRGVVRVADRATVEFEAARAAIAKAEGRAP